MSSPVIDTPSKTADAAAAAPAAAAKNHPLIRGYTASGRAKRELTLWPNARATQEELTRPDMTGVLSVTAPGPDGKSVEIKRNVSAWLKFDGDAPRVTIMSNLNDGGKLLGSVRAMKIVQGKPADGARGLRLIGDMDIDIEGSKQKFTVTGDLNARYSDRQEMLDSALAMGFPQMMVDAYAKRLEHDAAQRALDAVRQAGRRPRRGPEASFTHQIDNGRFIVHATHHGLEFEAVPFHFPKPCFRLLAHQTGEIHLHGVDGLDHGSAASLMASLAEQAVTMGRDAFTERWSDSTAQAYEVQVLAIGKSNVESSNLGTAIVFSASPGEAGKADAQHVALLSLWNSDLDATCEARFVVEEICDDELVCRSEVGTLPTNLRTVRP